MTYLHHHRRTRGATLTLVTLVAALGCRGDVTPPSTSVPVPGHPAGLSHAIIPSIPGRPFGIRVSNTNKLAVTQQELNSVTLLDVSGAGERLVVPVGADPGEVVFNRAGTSAFVSGFFDGSVKLTHVANGTVAALTTVGANAYRLALSPDERRLYVSSTDGSLYVVNPDAPTIITPMALGGALHGLALTTDGATLYVSSTTGRVSRLTASTLAISASNNVAGVPQDVAVTTDGSEVFVANERGWIDVLDGATLISKLRISLASAAPFGLAISPDDVQIYVTSSMSGQVIVYDRATRAIVRTIDVGGIPRRVAFSANGQSAFVANEGGWVDVIR